MRQEATTFAEIGAPVQQASAKPQGGRLPGIGCPHDLHALDLVPSKVVQEITDRFRVGHNLTIWVDRNPQASPRLEL